MTAILAMSIHGSFTWKRRMPMAHMHSHGGDLRHAIADACANRAVGRNQRPGDSDIDDAGKNRCEDDIALALGALQKALDGRKKCLGHAEQRSNGHDHGRARVPVP